MVEHLEASQISINAAIANETQLMLDVRTNFSLQLDHGTP
jgi:hypothetical protein